MARQSLAVSDRLWLWREADSLPSEPFTADTDHRPNSGCGIQSPTFECQPPSCREILAKALLWSML